MNLLHTADWHLGQTFYQYDRYNEHQYFLDNLLQIIEEQHTDVLLISGDVFDTANPAVRLYALKCPNHSWKIHKCIWWDM